MAGPTYDNQVTIVTGTPVSVSDVNTAIATLNTAGYWVTIVKYLGANTVAILSVLSNYTAFGHTNDQHINQVAANQTAVDADVAAEAANDYKPTGIGDTAGGDFIILYTLDPYAQGAPS